MEFLFSACYDKMNFGQGLQRNIPAFGYAWLESPSLKGSLIVLYLEGDLTGPGIAHTVCL